jgi:hypothetical protein
MGRGPGVWVGYGTCMGQSTMALLLEGWVDTHTASSSLNVILSEDREGENLAGMDKEAEPPPAPATNIAIKSSNSSNSRSVPSVPQHRRKQLCWQRECSHERA